MLFRRLRLRWRERRFDRKLRESGAQSPPPSRELQLHRVAIHPVPLETKNDTRTSTAEPLAIVQRSRSHPRGTPLDRLVVMIIKQYNLEQRLHFKDDKLELCALERFVPSTKPHVDTWLRKQQNFMHRRVVTDRDFERWKRTQRQLHDELRRIRDLVRSATRLHLLDRKCSSDETLVMGDEFQDSTRNDRAFLLNVRIPHPEICVAMVFVAMVAGIYGLLFLAFILKLLHKI